MGKYLLVFVVKMRALILAALLLPAMAHCDPTSHLGATAFLSAGTCMFMSAATNFEEPWAAAIAGFAAGNLAGLAVEAEQGMRGDYQTDLGLNFVGSALGALGCKWASESIKESRMQKSAIEFHGGGPGGSMGAGLSWRF